MWARSTADLVEVATDTANNYVGSSFQIGNPQSAASNISIFQGVVEGTQRKPNVIGITDNRFAPVTLPSSNEPMAWICWIYDGQTLKSYKNNVLEKNVQFNFNIDGTSLMWFGISEAGNFGSLQMCNFQIFDYDLSDLDRAAIFQAKSPNEPFDFMQAAECSPSSTQYRLWDMQFNEYDKLSLNRVGGPIFASMLTTASAPVGPIVTSEWYAENNDDGTFYLTLLDGRALTDVNGVAQWKPIEHSVSQKFVLVFPSVQPTTTPPWTYAAIKSIANRILRNGGSTVSFVPVTDGTQRYARVLTEQVQQSPTRICGL